jgi:hypothetical protein
MGYGLEGRDKVKRLSLVHGVQNDSGTHTTSYKMGTVGSHGGKAAEE